MKWELNAEQMSMSVVGANCHQREPRPKAKENKKQNDAIIFTFVDSSCSLVPFTFHSTRNHGLL
jgi:hypothetical protein